ncbi:hypothetical protein KRZ98_23630 [Sphingobium sp. AS12]|uniref:hypothetical protein n=1 Tax=Sphingobium sp. AS12 TaxID=2849495 RepID=UPI001C31AA82|nr:hypothetical protein [Sphingobium sp. AS12]MBV2151194.1 hypothetical protein [Sphingobium sp. AS12]
MSDLDQLLGQIRAMPADARLEQMDGAVMQAVVCRREQGMARRSLMLAGLLALGIGWAGSIVPSAPAQAASTPIGMSDYAPSRLLGQ